MDRSRPDRLVPGFLKMLLLYIVCQSLLSFAAAKDPLHVGGSKTYFYPKYRHEVFYDNKLIPEDTEVDVYLYKGNPQKMFFVLESGYRPISVTVTPCSSQAVLEWKISHSIFQNQPSDASYRSVTWSNHVLRPPSSSPAATYVGRDRRSYTNPRAPPGMYTLELKSNAETRAKVLVTTRSITHMPYHPPLPPESGVQIIKIKRNRILISWKASLSNRPVEYCVTSNNRHNYNSLCSAETDITGTTPSFAHHSVSRHGLATITCVGRKTWHLFKGLQRGKTYFFDVFVLDAETNASSAYVGVSATLRGSGATPSRIKDESLVTFSLDETNGYAVNTKYQMGRATGPVLVFIQSCTGPGPVNLHISQNGIIKQEIMSTTVMDVKTLEVPRHTTSPNTSFFTLSVRSTTSHPRKVRLWLSSKRHTFPFPVLPHDKSVRVFDTLTTCDSITIGWKISPDERVKYCIYKQAAHDELMQRTLAEPQNFCEPQQEGSVGRSTVLCRRYHRFSKRRFNNLIMQRVKGLRPGTRYLFEVQVTKVKGQMLPYEQVWAMTHDTCSHSRNKR